MVMYVDYWAYNEVNGFKNKHAYIAWQYTFPWDLAISSSSTRREDSPLMLSLRTDTSPSDTIVSVKFSPLLTSVTKLYISSV